MVRSVRRLMFMLSGALLMIAVFALPVLAQEEEPEPAVEEASSSAEVFWFNSAAIRYAFLAILIVVFIALAIGYTVKVLIPKYRGRPA